MCLKRGVRMTQARRAIARLLSSTSDHPGVEEIYERLRKVDDTISRAAIYSTLALFEGKNIVARRDFGDGRARYEPMSGPDDHHHHLVDVDTGEVVEFYAPELEDLKKQIAQDLGFDLVGDRLELFGRRVEQID